jgi:YbgC/YbaW family acyl-CoA thioester hydrolase
METPNVPASEALRFRVELATRWSDEDNQSMVNNAVYMTLLEETRHAYFRALDLLSANKFPFVLAQTNISFVSPMSGGTRVEVEASTVQLGTKSFTQAYRVRELPGRRVVCEAVARLVAWDESRRSSTPMGDEFRARIERFER